MNSRTTPLLVLLLAWLLASCGAPELPPPHETPAAPAATAPPTGHHAGDVPLPCARIDYDVAIDASLTMRYQRDDAGRLLAETVDYSSDGEVELTLRYTYDDRGRIASTGWEDKDGVPYTPSTYVYDDDAGGRLVRIDHGGQPSVVYTYDVVGRRLTEAVVDVSVFIDSYGYDDDTDPLVRTIAHDWSSDGTIDAMIFLRYDDDGQETVRKRDDENDGTIDDVWATERGDDGRALIERHTDIDGVLQDTRTWDYCDS